MNEGGDKKATKRGASANRRRGRKAGPFLKIKAGSAVVPIYRTESQDRVRYTVSFYRGGGVAGEVPFRVFRCAPASPFHLTRYETNTTTKSLDDPPKASINLTKCWQRKGDHFRETLQNQ